MIIGFISINYHWNLSKRLSVEHLFPNLWAYMRTREESEWFAHNMDLFICHHHVWYGIQPIYRSIIGSK